jgi:hypothetical protein
VSLDLSYYYYCYFMEKVLHFTHHLNVLPSVFAPFSLSLSLFTLSSTWVANLWQLVVSCWRWVDSDALCVIAFGDLWWFAVASARLVEISTNCR